MSKVFPDNADLQALGLSMFHLFRYVQSMIDENVQHKTKGFGLKDMTWADQGTHLVDESREAQDANSYDDKVAELADVFGVLVHMCCYLKLTHSELIAMTMHKLALRFEVPKLCDRSEPGTYGEPRYGRPIVSVDMGKPGSDHTVHYTIDAETLEIEETTEVVQAAEEECLRDELTSILYHNVKDIDVFTASAVSMLAKSYFNLKREKEAKSGQGSSTQPAV